MKSLLRQLAVRPRALWDLLGATFFVHLLGLAGTVFVILVFNNYLPYGVNATLMTLAIGAIIASLAEAGFREVRHRLIVELLAAPVANVTRGAFSVLARARRSSLMTASAQEIPRSLDAIEQLAAPMTVAAVLDAPFAIIAFVALFLVSPPLCLIALVALVVAWAFLAAGHSRQRALVRDLAVQEGRARSLSLAVIEQPDTVRAFGAAPALEAGWDAVRNQLQAVRGASAASATRTQTMTGLISACQGTAIIGVGALSASAGDLSAGALIGANILAARALAPMLRLAGMTELFARASLAEQRIAQVLSLPRESEKGVEIPGYAGGLELSDLAFAHPDMAGPLFERLSLRLAPGGALAVIGGNGSGKTTLARLLCALIEPTRGQILVDGTDLRQISPLGWRRQISYLPQEPVFLEASIAENLRVLRPDLAEDRLREILVQADLQEWLDRTAQGLSTPLPDGGRSLSLGVRKRLALARALATEGRLALFDEPTDALDDAGRHAVYNVLNGLRKAGVTLVVMTHDPYILRGMDWVLDLRIKPVPSMYPVVRQGDWPAIVGDGKIDGKPENAA